MDRTATDGKPTNSVILVHGMLGQRHIYWNVLRRRLIRDGFRIHEAILPYGMLGDIRIAARILADKVEATMRGDEVEKVDLVCHSAGGLVARYYLNFLDGDRHVAHLVTMGTPHMGTWFSYVLPWPVLALSRQTRPGSHFLQEINGPGAAPKDVKITNFWSPTDGVVLPAANGIMAGANNIKVPWTTHWDYLWRPAVHDRVKEALLDGRQLTLDEAYRNGKSHNGLATA